jgi:predicted permease
MLNVGRGLAAFRGDVRFGWRQMRRAPAFTAIAVLSLALGIGANTAIFSFVDALLLKPAAGVADPSAVVEIGRSRNGSGSDTMSYPDVLDLRRGMTTLSEVFAYTPTPLNLRAAPEAETRRGFGMLVTANYFDAVGVAPAFGRGFRPDEDGAGAPPTVVVSHAYWTSQLGAAPGAVGATVTVNGQAMSIVGVLPREFRSHWGVLAPDVFVPMGQFAAALPGEPDRGDRLAARGSFWLLAGGRLAPGRTVDEARAELAALAPSIVETHPEDRDTMGLALERGGALTADLRQPLALFAGVLFALVGTLLLLASFNVAGLLLARGERRRPEIALRRALGAERGRIVRQLLAEAALLLGLAALAAIPLARWAVAGILAMQPPTPVPIVLDVPLDARVLAFTCAVAALAVLLFALAPALRVSAQDPASALKAGGAAGSSRSRLRNGLVVAQVAGSMVLLGVSALLISALGRAVTIPMGFEARDVFSYETDLSLAGYDAARGSAFADRLVERLESLPGVEAAAVGAVLPLDFVSMGFGPIHVPGAEGGGGEEGFDASVNVVTPAWFETLRIPLEGRAFDGADRSGAPRVAIVNRTAARRFFGDAEATGAIGATGASGASGASASALGRTFELEGADGREAYTVVGVAGDGKYKWLGEENEAHVYFPLAQQSRGAVHVVVRARSGATPNAAATGLSAAVAREIHALDPHVALAGPRLLESVARSSSLPQRVGASVSSGLGALGLVLAAIGLYGALALRVGERRREIGVRLALGARPRDVGGWVAREGARLTAIGLTIGLVLTAGAGFVLRGLLYGASPLAPLALIAAPAVLAAIALAAALGPILQAARVDPATSLRAE